MKKFLFLLCFQVLLMACNKEELTPAATTQSQVAAVKYEDANISIVNFKAEKIRDSQLIVSFSTLYEKNIKKIELMTGNTPNNLCAIYHEDKSKDSFQSLEYVVVDQISKGAIIYYMIRFTLKNGDWGFTPVYKYQSR